MEEVKRDFFSELPQGFVADALSLTSPLDTCRLSSVNSFFQSAAEWDSVWESFTPTEYLAEASGNSVCSSKKEVYLRLCDHPIIIDQGNKSFWLDKRSGKKCYMLAARQMSISLVDSPSCWKWISIEGSSVCSLEVSCTINASILSPNTTYVAHLVYKTATKAYGFEYQPVELCINSHGEKGQNRMAYLDPQAGNRRRLQPRRRIGIFSIRAFTNYDEVPSPSKDNGPKLREDGWFEIEIGEYSYDGGDETKLEMSIMEVKGGNWKTGLIIEGIEIRPKNCI